MNNDPSGKSRLTSKIPQYLEHNEGLAVAGLLLCYTLVLFVVPGSFPVFIDNPAYVDPAINYLKGHGFTSTCWYAQPADEFWAGNVPLYQFLLIPWFKILPIAYVSVLSFNFLCTALAVVAIWQAAKTSNFIETALWRLTALIYILLTDTAYYLLTFGRPEPLAFLLIALAFLCATFRDTTARLIALVLIGSLVPWAHLFAATYLAALAALLFVFYRKALWREIVSFGLGGILGAAGLVLFYHHFGVWEGFLRSVTPHVGGGISHLKSHSRGGLTQSFMLPYLGVTALILLFLQAFRRQDWKLPLFTVTCLILIPSLLLKVGVFPLYYGWSLVFLISVLLFSVISRNQFLNRSPLLVASLLILTSALAPGNFLRRTLKNRLQNEFGPTSEMQAAEFLKSVIRADDVPRLDPIFYYAAQPIAKQIYFGGFIPGFFASANHNPRVDDELKLMSVWIWRKNENEEFPANQLPGEWRATGENLETWGSSFIVYRRIAPSNN